MVSVFVALGTQQAMTTHHVVICGLPGFTVFFHIIAKWHDFLKKVNDYVMCVLTFSPTFVWNISHYKKNKKRCDQKHILVLV